MGIFRRTDNRQIFTGIFLLVLLAVFAGPNTLPRLLSSAIPFIDESIPCEWLKTGDNRAQHQSLIGRGATSPLALSAKSSPIPNTPDGSLVISITVINTSIGTVPFVFNPRQVIVGDNGTSGLGIVFSPPNTLSTGAARQDTASYAESDIRLLGPRQRCVHKLSFPASQIDASLATGNATVVAYYRNNVRGQIIQAQGPGTVIFSDQGLWTGFVNSEPTFIPLSAQ